MGIVRSGVPEELTMFLKRLCSIDTFVETGTYLGCSAEWADQYFKTHTIEMSEKYYLNAKKLLSHTSIEFYHGHSKSILKGLFSYLEGDTIFWLDAHWSGGDTYGESDECPLLEEVELILRNFPENACILIDDARLFLAPPPLPHKAENWPGLQDIINLLQDDKHYMTIYEDVIIIVPKKVKADLVKYLQTRTTKDWENHINNQKKYLPQPVKQSFLKWLKFTSK